MQLWIEKTIRYITWSVSRTKPRRVVPFRITRNLCLVLSSSSAKKIAVAFGCTDFSAGPRSAHRFLGYAENIHTPFIWRIVTMFDGFMIQRMVLFVAYLASMKNCWWKFIGKCSECGMCVCVCVFHGMRACTRIAVAKMVSSLFVVSCSSSKRDRDNVKGRKR